LRLKTCLCDDIGYNDCHGGLLSAGGVWQPKGQYKTAGFDRTGFSKRELVIAAVYCSLYRLG